MNVIKGNMTALALEIYRFKKSLSSLSGMWDDNHNGKRDDLHRGKAVMHKLSHFIITSHTKQPT